MTRKSGLGRGLDALIVSGEGEFPRTEGINHVDINSIVPNPRQPRRYFNPSETSELAASIREHGVLQPLILTYGDSENQYVLIAGERRLIASREAGLKEVPALIRKATELERLELALIENLQRSDLDPVEAAEAYRQLNEDFGLSHDEIAKHVGKSRTAVTNTMRLLKLPALIKQGISDGKISEGHARVLLALPNTDSKMAVYNTILQKQFNVRQTEAYVRKITSPEPASKPGTQLPAELRDLEDSLRTALGTKVNLNHKQKRGTLVIHYYSDEELETIVNRILSE